MSVLIKGMEMPPKGQGRMFLYDDNTAIWLNLDTGERIAYEVIPVPTPHGRLIDADSLIAMHENAAHSKGGASYSFHMAARTWVMKAPTIIEAEEEE